MRVMHQVRFAPQTLNSTTAFNTANLKSLLEYTPVSEDPFELVPPGLNGRILCLKPLKTASYTSVTPGGDWYPGNLSS
jgi:hypothetical protein